MLLQGRGQGHRLEHGARGKGAGEEAVEVDALIPLVPLLMSSGGFSGSKEGADTMHRISPVL